MVPGVTDTNTDCSCDKTIDTNMALCHSQGSDVTMVSSRQHRPLISTWSPFVSPLSDTKLATGGSPDPRLLYNFCSNVGHGCQHRLSSHRIMNSDVAIGSSPGLDINLFPGDKQVTNISLFFMSLAPSILPLTTAQKSSRLSFFPICLPYTSSH